MLDEADGLGTGFVMNRVEGETVARKIFRDDRFAAARPVLARQCGDALGRICQVPVAECPSLEMWDARRRLDDTEAAYRAQRVPRPVFEYALRWLRERLPADRSDPRLVHGDFRNGNLIIDEKGIAAVLDWELAHFGSPLEDLGWLCVPSWRFGRLDDVAGGFGSVEALIEGFEAASGPAVDRVELHFWMVLGTLLWGQVCIRTALEFRDGRFAIEPAVIGRRVSEVELDLMMLTATRDGELS
jgi:aminoglycoside phosphotransferase (APT) family kinase protein